MTSPTTDTLETLADELRNFCDEEGLPQDCAEELLSNPALTQPQRQWLIDFGRRWDALNQPEADWGVDDDSDTSDGLSDV
jgi:hypothetical protein